MQVLLAIVSILPILGLVSTAAIQSAPETGHSATVTQKVVAPILPASTAAVEVSLHKSIRAYYYYSCPHAGPDYRVFNWESSYKSKDRLLHLQGHKNIDRIDHITMNHQYFNTYWHHSTCAYELDTVCFYSFRGYTFGHIEPDRLIMDLVTNSDDPVLAPTVYESCVPKHLMPKNFCTISYTKRMSVPCEMEDVEAFAV